MIEDKNQSRTALSELGEFGLIDHLTQNFKIQHSSTIKGIGDDAAVIENTNSQTLVTTDLLIEGVHFDLSYMPLKHLGYKAVVVNLSDVYAMNGDAKQITVSIAVSNRFPLEAIEELYEGIYTACKTYNIDLIGGDTTSSTTGLLISITAIGEVAKEDVVYRSTAKPNDLLVVSGDLGAAYLGLQVLEREKQVFQVNPNSQPDLTNYSYLVERQLKPEARKDIVKILKELGETDELLLKIIEQHHEKCDGSGYPYGLIEAEIQDLSKIVAICDIFNALTTRRTYKERMNSFFAFNIMFNEMKNKLSASYLKKFILFMGHKEEESSLKLS